MSEGPHDPQQDTLPIAPIGDGSEPAPATPEPQNTWFDEHLARHQAEEPPADTPWIDPLHAIAIVVAFLLIALFWMIVQYNPGWLSASFLTGAVAIASGGLYWKFKALWTVTILVAIGLMLEGTKFFYGRNWPNTTALIVLAVFAFFVGLRHKRGSLKDAQIAEYRRLAEEKIQREKEHKQVPKPSERARKVIPTNDHLIEEVNQHPIVLTAWVVGLVLFPAGVQFYVHNPVGVLLLTALFGLMFEVLTTGLDLLLNRRRRWRYVYSSALVVSLLAWLISYVGENGWLVLGFLLLAAMALRVGVWKYNRWCLTTNLIIPMTGFLSENVSRVPLIKISDIKMHIPWWSKLLAWLRVIRVEVGNLGPETAGRQHGAYSITNVPGVYPLFLIMTGQTLDELQAQD